MFAAGSFNAPMIIHDTNPPGVATMARLKEQIRYEFSETDRCAGSTCHGKFGDHGRGARLLLFQIVDHRTADAPTKSHGLPRK